MLHRSSRVWYSAYSACAHRLWSTVSNKQWLLTWVLWWLWLEMLISMHSFLAWRDYYWSYTMANALSLLWHRWMQQMETVNYTCTLPKRQSTDMIAHIQTRNLAAPLTDPFPINPSPYSWRALKGSVPCAASETPRTNSAPRHRSEKKELRNVVQRSFETISAFLWVRSKLRSPEVIEYPWLHGYFFSQKSAFLPTYNRQ